MENHNNEEKKKQKSHDVAVLLLFVVLLLLAWIIFGVVWALVTRVPERKVPVVESGESVVTSTPIVPRLLLNGAAAMTPDAVAEPVVGVMIDMHRDAQPVSGIEAAQVVYEVPVEGGIHRLLALFTKSARVDEVGPIRSARPYAVDIAGEYGALYMHVGGSPAAVEQLATDDAVTNLDQWYFSQYYWRDRRRASPHHIYTSSSRFGNAAQARGMVTSTFGSWLFTDEQPLAWNEALTLSFPTVNQGRPLWKFFENGYVRMFGDTEYRTRSGAFVSASTIIVQQVRQKVLDAEGRLELGVHEEGFAWFLRDGRVAHGFWKYSKKENRTRWYDDQGNEVGLKPGLIWVQVVPVGVEPRF
ncbi:MAG: DUF3048 domain-containing protein [Candidatus Magasanikbacteria bacterium]|nr:DUF3048 domain-containing protein [Candidatus Magasanikbacteria bacterium]